MRKLKQCVAITILLAMSSSTVSYAVTQKDVKVVYNTKVLDLGNKKVINKEGSIYIPLRAFGEKLHYKVLWDNSTNTARIYDNLRDISLSTNGAVKINGVESQSSVVPIMVDGSTYVPLRFVSESLGIDVSYQTSSNGNQVKMSGNTIYDIYAPNIDYPYLTAHFEDWTKQSALIDEKQGSLTPTTVVDVNRTKNGEVVTTSSTHSGARTFTWDNQHYVHEKDFLGKGNMATLSYDIYTGKGQSTKFYDDRVALLNDGIIEIYDDISGELVKNIDPKATFKEQLDGKYKFFDNNGEVFNIQAVGKDFLVVNMLQPLSYATTEDENFLQTYYYTTVINTETLEMFPVYENLNYVNEHRPIGDGEIARSGVYKGGYIPNDLIYFDKVTEDGKLQFAGVYNDNGEKKYEYCKIQYK